MNYRTLYAVVALVGVATFNLALPTSSEAGLTNVVLSYKVCFEEGLYI